MASSGMYRFEYHCWLVFAGAVRATEWYTSGANVAVGGGEGAWLCCSCSNSFNACSMAALMSMGGIDGVDDVRMAAASFLYCAWSACTRSMCAAFN